MLGLRYHILYRKRKENIVANSLSRRNNSEVVDKEVGSVGMITKIISSWYDEIHAFICTYMMKFTIMIVFNKKEI